MPLEYVEPKKWKNKKKIKFPVWTETAKKEIETSIHGIPEGAEAKIIIEYVISIKRKSKKREKMIKKKKEQAVPHMGHWEYDIFKGAVSYVKLGDKSVKIQILWNKKQNLLEKREEKILKEFKRLRPPKNFKNEQ